MMKPISRTFGVILAALTLAACGNQAACPAIDPSVVAEVSPGKHVIADLDMAHEDMIALTVLLQTPGITVDAITISGTGEVHCEAGIDHALQILDLHDAPDIPVACGRETPLSGSHEFPAEWRANADNLYGLSLPETSRAPSTMTAPDLIAQVVTDSAQPVTLVAVGPLTNFADTLQNDPSLAGNIEALYTMGGAVDAPGNVDQTDAGIDPPISEWNYYIDPLAVQIVLESGIPITMVPLDATKDVPITTEIVNCTGKNRETPEADFTYQLLDATRELISFGGFEFWDTATASVLGDASLATFETRTLVVDIEGDEAGRTREDASGVEVRVAVGIDRARFEARLVNVLMLGSDQ